MTDTLADVIPIRPDPDPAIPTVAAYLIREGWSAMRAFDEFGPDMFAAVLVRETAP